jgi:RTX calcium-binding nonapeptide repeat (4 copies)
VEVCSDGSVLAKSFNDSVAVRRLTLSGTGTLTDTGEALSLIVGSSAINVYCAPSAASGVVIHSFAFVTSFTIPGLSMADESAIGSGALTQAAINPAGNRLFLHGTFPPDIAVFDFTQATGAIGAPILTIPVKSSATPYRGIDQIALHPNGGKLFFSEEDALNVYDPSTGALLASITDPAIVDPTGVMVVTKADPCAGTPPAGAIVGTNDPNVLAGTPGNDTIFGLGGDDTINGGGGDDFICGGDGNDVVNSGAGNDFLDGGLGFDVLNGGPGINTCVNGEVTNSCS